MRVSGRRRRTRPADPKDERSFTIVSDCTSAKCSGESKSTGVGMLGLTNQLGGRIGCCDFRRATGEHGIRTDRVPVPRHHGCERPGGGPIRQTVACGQGIPTPGQTGNAGHVSRQEVTLTLGPRLVRWTLMVGEEPQQEQANS